MSDELDTLELSLDSFDAAERSQALGVLARSAAPPPDPNPWVNMHCHTFFSYNALGYSPSRIAWLAKRRGLAAAGIVDFDVLDGAEEFLAAGRLLGLQACAGIETRVFVAEFADKVMNSPGEPGIAYQVGVGIPRGSVPPEWRAFLLRLRQTSAERNRDLVARVNGYLDPVRLDYDRDVVPLTPAGNATERHICLAYARAARAAFGDGSALAIYWRGKLGDGVDSVELPESIGLQSLIRSRTMKIGGAGYVRPDSGSFPRMEEMNRFIIAAGGIPAYGWLDGLSEGEADLEPLVRTAMASGAAAINVIPGRNYTRGEPDLKLHRLYEAMELTKALGLPVIAGTEMNSPEHRFVDDFEAPEMAPVVEVIMQGAYVCYAHSELQRAAGLGYLSEWAKRRFPDIKARSAFYCEIGRRLQPGQTSPLAGLRDDADPEAILRGLAK